MTKKMIILCFAIVICLGLFVGCNNADLEKYKEAKTEELLLYVNTKDKENYSADGWQAVCNAVEAGKTSIMAEKTKPAVERAFNEAKTAIDTVEQDEVSVGKFYTLQEAYEVKMLSIEDLQSIARYHADGTSPAEALSSDITSKIKKLAARNMHEREIDLVVDAKAEDFSITRYYGTYNECVALMINDPYHEYPAEDLDVNEEVAGVLFHYTDPNRIVVWKQ